jgi:hypothetical protein
MTTFWLTFRNPDTDYLGVAIFDMDESDGQRSVPEIVSQSWQLGVNPGDCAVGVQDVTDNTRIEEQHKNKLITDMDLLNSLATIPPVPLRGVGYVGRS